MNNTDKPEDRKRPEPVASIEELQAIINKYRADEANLRELITNSNSERERLSEMQREEIAIHERNLNKIVALRETAENELRIRREAEDKLNQA